jgi:pimeloyl-ACP methyl ester carboxylesterase
VNAHVFYLHGFASSPASTKARFFERQLSRYGVPLHCPDLNAPDFETLTVTRMIAQVERAILALPPRPTVLVGSSLGALVALELAGRWAQHCARAAGGAVAEHRIDRLVLLAPALDFAYNRQRHLGQERLARWKAEGSLEVFHYADGQNRRIRYGLYEDALSHDPFTAYLDFPILVFQGRRDESVDPGPVESFARSRPNVMLRLLDDDHRLLSSLDEIWRQTAEFLGLEAAG